MATGMAKGAHARGKCIAFGDGRNIIWDHNSEEIFKNNPNIAPLGSEKDSDLEWVGFYRGSRIYNRHDVRGERWVWNYKFRPIPGEIYFDDEELSYAEKFPRGMVIIEPNVPRWKPSSVNKQWPRINWFKLSKRLRRAGFDVRQFYYNGSWQIENVGQIKTVKFRQAAAILQRARLYIGPEGGMHHAAAAVGLPAVVIFGGFIPPAVTGYDFHTNITGGAQACGAAMRLRQHGFDGHKLDIGRQTLRAGFEAGRGEHHRHTGLQPLTETLEPASQAQMTQGGDGIGSSRRVDFHNALYIAMDVSSHPVSCDQKPTKREQNPLATSAERNEPHFTSLIANSRAERHSTEDE